MSPQVRLRLLTAADLTFAEAVRAAAGWNQTLADWQRFLALEPDGCFLAEWDGVPAGTATTLIHGPELAWIGMVLVQPELRRRGIGRALLHCCLDHVRQRGVQCIKLDATPLGQPVYEALGFRTEWALARWERRGMAAGASKPPHKPVSLGGARLLPSHPNQDLDQARQQPRPTRFMADEQVRKERVALYEPAVPGGARLPPSHPNQDLDQARQEPRPTGFMAGEQVREEQAASHEPVSLGGARLPPSHPNHDLDQARQEPRPAAWSDLDAAAFGVARTRLCEALLQQGAALRLAETADGEFAGFGLSRAGSRAHYLGPVVAASPHDGLTLIQDLLGGLEGEPVFWDIPEPNAAAVGWAEAHGFQRQRTLTRMFLGKNLCPGNPARQFALAGPEVG